MGGGGAGVWVRHRIESVDESAGDKVGGEDRVRCAQEGGVMTEKEKALVTLVEIITRALAEYGMGELALAVHEQLIGILAGEVVVRKEVEQTIPYDIPIN
jgi:hypothetical protein